jgi:ribonucleotide monophosphatase NagD (HAD superfamily)
MKNANVFVDVDLTLVDANRNLLPGATEALAKLKDKGRHLFLWSTNGADYARKIASLYHLTEMFEGFAAKPDIIIDDMPGTVLNPFVFDVNTEASWPALADRIIRKHID